jgi:hypothetical protein
MMFNSDTLASAASASLFETIDPQAIAATVFRAQATLPTVPEGNLQQAGGDTAEVYIPEPQLGDAPPELSAKRAVPEKIRYYDLKRNWTKKVVPHLDDEELNDVLRDFNKFTWGRWRTQFRRDEFPFCHETLIARFSHRCPMPRFWLFTKHGACHWLVNFALRLATLVVQAHAWQIITSDFHSPVWNGQNLLFDFNYLALGVPAHECFQSANDEKLAPGVCLEVGFPE